MFMEMKRSINNKTYILSMISCILCAILGYVLLTSIDKIEDVSLPVLQYSIYTVYTEFGFLIFPVLVVYIFTSDYREKNILFYKMLNYNAIKYYLSKVVITIFWFSMGTFMSLFVISVIYKDFTNFITVFLFFESALVYIVMVSSVIAFCCKNMLIAFCINLFLWIGSIMLSTVKNIFEYLCFYDASLRRHSNFEKFLNTSQIQYISKYEGWVYNLIILGIIILIVLILKKRWEKNGI